LTKHRLQEKTLVTKYLSENGFSYFWFMFAV